MMVMMVVQWCWVMTKMMMMIIIMMRMMMTKKNTGLRANPLNGSVKICRPENNVTLKSPQSHCFNGFLR